MDIYAVRLKETDGYLDEVTDLCQSNDYEYAKKMFYLHIKENINRNNLSFKGKNIFYKKNEYQLLSLEKKIKVAN